MVKGVPDVLVVGGGAVGALYGWRLASARDGEQPSPRVTVVCRSNYAAAAESGFKIKSGSWGESTFVPHRVANSVAEASRMAADGEPSWNGWDYIVVCTKAVSGASSLPDLVRPAVQASVARKAGNGSGTRWGGAAADQAAVPTLVLIQNGIGIERPLAEQFPECPLISVVAFVGVTASEPNIVTHVDVGQGRLFLSVYRPRGTASEKDVRVLPTAAETLHLFNRLLTAGGVQAKAVPSELMHAIRLHKLIWSAAVPPACVLARADFVVTLLTDPDSTELVRRVMDELWDVCAAELGREPFPRSRGRADRDALSAWQASVFPPDVVPSCTDQFVAYSRNVGNHPPSLLVDFNVGRDCEVDVTIGAAAELARKHGLDTPCLDAVLLLLRAAIRSRKSREIPPARPQSPNRAKGL